MKTDRELLELAAKSAGLEITDENGIIQRVELFRGHLINYFDWNPLDDDGDALRLANKLCMTINTGPCIAFADTIRGALRGNFTKVEYNGIGQEKAVRRAIVLAAAEIGENMQ